MGSVPINPRLERITRPPLTFEIWTRSSNEVRGHPVEVGVPNLQEAIKRLAVYGGPEYFEIRDSDGNLVYEAVREEEPHYHYHEQRVHAAPAPPSPPRTNERIGMMIVFGLVILILLLMIIANSRLGDDEPVTADTPALAVTPPAAEHMDGESPQSLKLPKEISQVGLPYSEVREALLRDGFEPVKNENSDQCWTASDDETGQCLERPEISYCSGTGFGYCSAEWYKDDVTLNIVIQEGPDGLLAGASKATMVSLTPE